MFEIKPTVPPDVKAYRKIVTRYYGFVTLISSFAFIILICLYSYYGPRYTSRKVKHRRLTAIHLNDRPLFRLFRYIRASNLVYIAAWTGLLSIVVFKDTMNDWTFLVKRLGRVAIALLPPTLFLTLKPSPLPRTFYLQLLPFHKWISRVIVLLSLAHGIIYTWIYFKTGKLAKLLKLENICGILAITAFLTMAITSLKFFRRQMYAQFYTIHYSLSWITVGLVWYHSKPPSPEYIFMCICILGFQIVYRFTRSGHLTLPVQFVSPSLLLIKIPKERLPNSLRAYHKPGAHLRLSMPLYNVSTWFKSSHPYTIASLPQEKELTLVIRRTQFPVKLRQTYAINGPFNSVPQQFFKDARNSQIKRILFVVGGSGIAFGAPILRYVKQFNVEVKMLWAIKDTRDIQVLEQLGLDEALHNHEIEVYVTQEPVHRPVLRHKISLGSMSIRSAGEHSQSQNEDDLDISVDNFYCSGSDQPLLADSNSKYSSDIQIFNHRPVLNLRLKTWLCGVEEPATCSCFDYNMVHTSAHDRRGAWVISSGGERLVHETSKWASSNGFAFYQEEFTL